MSHDQLAQIAFRAYCLGVDFHTHDGKPIPEWKDLTDVVRNAWIESVKAVLGTVAAEGASVVSEKLQGD